MIFEYLLLEYLMYTIIIQIAIPFVLQGSFPLARQFIPIVHCLFDYSYWIHLLIFDKHLCCWLQGHSLFFSFNQFLSAIISSSIQKWCNSYLIHLLQYLCDLRQTTISNIIHSILCELMLSRRKQLAVWKAQLIAHSNFNRFQHCYYQSCAIIS